MGKSKYQNSNVKLSLICFLILLIIPLSCQAVFWDDWFEDLFGNEELNSISTNSTQIINELRVEANTGGNKAGEGEAIEGEGEVNVEIKTIINGEEIDPVDIQAEANEVKVESEIKVENNESSVKREIEINPDNSCDTCEGIGIEDKGVIKGKINVVKSWWFGFIENLKSFVINIFDIF